MNRRKSYFDDRIFFDPRTNQLWIGRPDVKSGKEPWDWFLFNGNRALKGKNFGPPEHFIEIAREPEMSICGKGK